MNHLQPFERFDESKQQPQIPTTSHKLTRQGYIVRVELHKIKNSDEYKDLRDYMIKEGFRGVIADDQGVRFKLPTATYYHPYPDYNQFVSAIHEKAAMAVHEALEGAYAHTKEANRPPTILVTSADDLYWTGLELAGDDDE